MFIHPFYTLLWRTDHLLCLAHQILIRTELGRAIIRIILYGALHLLLDAGNCILPRRILSPRPFTTPSMQLRLRWPSPGFYRAPLLLSTPAGHVSPQDLHPSKRLLLRSLSRNYATAFLRSAQSDSQASLGWTARTGSEIVILTIAVT
jgi:hypothetical protein